MKHTLTTAGLRQEFGSITALDGVDLELSEPQILGIAGPNGSGKTTLLKCLLGLQDPADGTAKIGGTSSAAFTKADRQKIGYMPQGRALYEDLTVRENVAFFASLYGIDDSETIERTLSFVALDDRQHAQIDELSGGMIRRTSLACALVHDPAVLFLDEPTVGLDPQLRASMWEGFRQRRDEGAIVVVSTHYLGEVSRCDRVLFLREGDVLALDTPEAFLEQTGTDDMESAFLALLEDAQTDASGNDTGPNASPEKDTIGTPTASAGGDD